MPFTQKTQSNTEVRGHMSRPFLTKPNQIQPIGIRKTQFGIQETPSHLSRVGDAISEDKAIVSAEYIGDKG